MTLTRNKAQLAALCALAVLALLIPLRARNDTSPRLRYPTDDIGAESLPARKKAQLDAARQFKVFHDFQFTDRVKERTKRRPSDWETK